MDRLVDLNKNLYINGSALDHEITKTDPSQRILRLLEKIYYKLLSLLF